MSFRLLCLVILTFSIALTGCSSPFQPQAEQTRTLDEPPYQGTPLTISGPTYTVSGTASFNKRPTKTTGSSWYLDYTFETKPIVYAEFHIYDAANNLVQCGETDGSGNFSALIPATSNSYYIIKVYSRADNTSYRVSVLNDVNNNYPYSVDKSFFVATSSPGNIGSLIAEADDKVDPKIPGGAFNILYDIYNVNDFLRSTSSTVGYTVAPKVTVFWLAGFNPNTYRGGSATQGISYYIPGNRQLFIQGGINGDVTASDTDHFDDSIIMHEYGHFLEDVFGSTDSPGGSHNGDAVIDPRLAWSEGWANYIQSAIKTFMDIADITNSTYIDTYGYKESGGDSSGFGDLAVFAMTDDPTSFSSYDRPNATSEGLFREVSISRTLYKTTAPTTVGYKYSSATDNRSSLQIPFRYVWQAFTTGDTAIDGLHSSNLHFRSAGLFHYTLKSILTLHAVSTAGWTTMLSEEKQPEDNAEYAGSLAASAPACDVAISPSRNLSSSKTLGTVGGFSVYASNQLASNDFYRYCFDGSTNPTITMSYTQTGTPIVDLNMHAYLESYVYFEDVYSIIQNATSPYIVASTSLSPGTTSATKSISLAGQSAGCYLINIKARTTNANGSDKSTAELNNTTLTYRLSNNGGNLCPQVP